jgi:hypothetical protein
MGARALRTIAGRRTLGLLRVAIAGVCSIASGCALAGLFDAPVDRPCLDSTPCATMDPCHVGVCRGGVCTLVSRDDDHDGYAPEGCAPDTLPAGDCDGSDDLTYPDASEHCDRVDEDCDGRVDEACVPTAQLASGELATCALRSDGVVACWGAAASFGYVGDTATRPVHLALPRPATSIGFAGTGLCALLDDGTVHCGGTYVAHAPTPLAPLALADRAAVLLLGHQLVCATLVNGHTECHGEVVGQIVADAIGVATLDLPPHARASATNGLICVADDAGAVSCIGGDLGGALGQAGVLQSFAFLPVAGVSASVDLRCLPLGACCAIDDRHVLRCWGSAPGWLGMSVEPTVVATAAREFVGVSLTNDAICYRDEGGLVRCFTTTASGPTETTGFEQARQVTGTETFRCGRDADGVVSCSGANYLGQLGSGDTQDSSTPIVVRGI